MIHLDIFYHIFQHFAKLRNVHKFRHISKKVYNLINDDYLEKLKTQIIIERLNQLKLPGKKFVDVLIKSGAVIAGSFPLQCLLKETWKDSDIDIYCERNNPNGRLIREFIENLDDVQEGLIKNGYNELKRIFQVANYVTPNIAIQIIIPEQSVEESIDDFDLSFCKTVFDGKSVKIPRGALEKKGEINLFRGNRNDRDEILSLAKRLIKYRKRGFKFENFDTFECECIIFYLDFGNFLYTYIWGSDGIRLNYRKTLKLFNWDTSLDESPFQIGIRTGPNNNFICIKECNTLEEAKFYESPKINIRSGMFYPVYLPTNHYLHLGNWGASKCEKFPMQMTCIYETIKKYMTTI